MNTLATLRNFLSQSQHFQFREVQIKIPGLSLDICVDAVELIVWPNYTISPTGEHLASLYQSVMLGHKPYRYQPPGKSDDDCLHFGVAAIREKVGTVTFDVTEEFKAKVKPKPDALTRPLFREIAIIVVPEKSFADQAGDDRCYERPLKMAPAQNSRRKVRSHSG